MRSSRADLSALVRDRNCPPYPSGRVRKIEMVDAERPQRIDHGVGERRDRAGGAGLARTLGAEQVGRGWNAMLVELRAGEDVGLGHRIVHERTREELPV